MKFACINHDPEDEAWCTFQVIFAPLFEVVSLHQMYVSVVCSYRKILFEPLRHWPICLNDTYYLSRDHTKLLLFLDAVIFLFHTESINWYAYLLYKTILWLSVWHENKCHTVLIFLSKDVATYAVRQNAYAKFL